MDLPKNDLVNIIFGVFDKDYGNKSLEELYDDIMKIFESHGINTKYLRLGTQTILFNIFRYLSWGPRYPSEDIKIMYASDFENCNRLTVQYMFGAFLYNTVDKYVRSKCISNYKNRDDKKFIDIFCHFAEQRDLWQSMIKFDSEQFQIRKVNQFVYTEVTGRYSFFIPIILKHFNTIKDLPADILRDKYKISKVVYTKYQDFTFYELTFNISDSISHKITLHLDNENKPYTKASDSFSGFECETIITPQIFEELDVLHNKILDAIAQKNREQFLYLSGCMYYSIVSLSPLKRGTGSVSDMFNIYYNRLWSPEYLAIKCIKKDYHELSAYALSTPPKIFLDQWCNDELYDEFPM